jgi:hypothetical protein
MHANGERAAILMNVVATVRLSGRGPSLLRSNSPLRSHANHHTSALLLWCNGLLREGLWWALWWGSLDGMQGVRGSNPLSSTRHNASAALPLRAVCQQIVSRLSADRTGLERPIGDRGGGRGAGAEPPVGKGHHDQDSAELGPVATWVVEGPTIKVGVGGIAQAEPASLATPSRRPR